MRLLMICMECSTASGQPNAHFAEFRDDSRYEHTCSNGHRTTTILQQQRFEILFEIGAHAILDGYYREAVSSFTSSLERFYEFAIRVFLDNASCPDTVVQECWKRVSSQSERQLGAFIVLWAATFKTTPNLLPQKSVELRNDVIHKGRIPTRDMVIKYGVAVLEVLRTQISAIQSQFPNEVQRATLSHLSGSRNDSDKDKTVATYGLRTIVSLMVGEPSHHSKSLEEHLAELLVLRNGLF